MDQACAFGATPVLMSFDGDVLGVAGAPVAAPLHFVLVDLGAAKDTVAILAGLQVGGWGGVGWGWGGGCHLWGCGFPQSECVFCFRPVGTLLACIVPTATATTTTAARSVGWGRRFTTAALLSHTQHRLVESAPSGTYAAHSPAHSPAVDVLIHPLQSAFPHPTTDEQRACVELLGEVNADITRRAAALMAAGDVSQVRRDGAGQGRAGGAGAGRVGQPAAACASSSLSVCT